MREHLTAKRGWIGLGLGIITFELACPVGETLSEGCDKALEAQRLLTVGVIGVTALHLANLIPESIDPFTQVVDFLKG